MVWNKAFFAISIVAFAYGHNFSAEHIAALEEFRELVKGANTEDYMLEDYYLGQWLRSTGFNVQEALDKFHQYLNLRDEYNLATILVENWSDMRALFPYSRDTFDKLGRPVLYLDAEKWNVANFLASNDTASERFLRYTLMFLEESLAHVRKLREDGHDVTDFMELINVAGFGIQKHCCFSCILLYRQIHLKENLYFSVFLSKVVFINVPYAFKVAFSVFGKEAQSFYHLYGQDRSQWEAGVLEFIDHEQLPSSLFADISLQDNSEGLLSWNEEL